MATVNYTVRPGDTLWNIAEKFDTSVNDIARYNGISDVNQIYPGQVLRIATQFPVVFQMVYRPPGRYPILDCRPVQYHSGTPAAA